MFIAKMPSCYEILWYVNGKWGSYTNVDALRFSYVMAFKICVRSIIYSSISTSKIRSLWLYFKHARHLVQCQIVDSVKCRHTQRPQSVQLRRLWELRLWAVNLGIFPDFKDYNLDIITKVSKEPGHQLSGAFFGSNYQQLLLSQAWLWGTKVWLHKES